MLTRRLVWACAALAAAVPLATAAPALAGGGVSCGVLLCRVEVTSPGSGGGVQTTPGTNDTGAPAAAPAGAGGGGGSTSVAANAGGAAQAGGGGSQVSAAQWTAILEAQRKAQIANMKDASTMTCSGGATYIPIYGTCGAYQTPPPKPKPGKPGAPPAPPAPPPPPTYTPWQAAQKALNQLVLSRPAIGSAPCTTAGCQGTVGVPVWLWTQRWPQQAVSATAGPFTVTAKARVSQVVWTLGDGHAITCTSSGTAYVKSMGWRESPDCGYPGWQKAGDYTVTATMTWDVTWSGATAGATTQTTAASVPVKVGEYQAIVTFN